MNSRNAVTVVVEEIFLPSKEHRFLKRFQRGKIEEQRGVEKRERERERERRRMSERGIGHCFGPLFPKQTASTLFRQEILCSARQAGRTGNGLLSVLLFVINTRVAATAAIIPPIRIAMHVKVIVAMTRLGFFLLVKSFLDPL